MVHGQPFEGFQKILHISVSITCHWNLRTGHLGKSIASPFTEILPTLDLFSAPACGEYTTLFRNPSIQSSGT